ncbi:T9SS type A sorting domain-containing protein [Aurantibacter sp.]|uniref:T9SS type A sorting domain-containing protein n=1 Tax=Aurantibacter sp. TaxID=2807103 RepID=UPI0035C79199
MKKTTLIITLLLTSAFSFGQLNVRNDAFVFVNDEVLFVTEEVNIQETTANVYLRNEAQLLQGASQTITNRGEGKLSVFQEGEASVFTHNIWGSPVGTFNSAKGSYTANGNTPFIPEDNIFEAGTDSDPSLAPITSFPVTFINGYNSNGNSTLNTSLTIGTGDDLEIARYWFWKFGPSFGGSTGYADWSYVGQDGNVEPGYGFTMKGTDEANQQYDFRGRPNSGTITTDLVYVPRNAGVQVPSFTMMGNPYPSALDSRDFIHDAANTNLYVDTDPAISNGTIYFWEQEDTGTHELAGYSAGYAAYTISPAGVMSFVDAIMKTYNQDGTIATTGAATGNGKVVGRYLPIGQGFMVRAAINSADPDVGLNYTVEFNNSQREYIKESSGSSFFFKASNSKNSNLTSQETLQEENNSINAEGFASVPSDFKRFRLNVDFNDTYTRQLLHNFHDSTSEGKDYGFETELPSTLDSDIWWPRLGEKLNGNANKFDVELSIPLHLITSSQQSLRFRILDIQNFEIDQAIYIHDKELDLYHDLTIQDFEIALPTGNYSNRFEVTFQDENKLLNITTVDELSNFNIFQNNNTTTLNFINPKATNVSEINVYDVTGKRIFNSLKMNTQERFEISTRSLSEGVYVVKVNFANGNYKSKKIIISQN